MDAGFVMIRKLFKLSYLTVRGPKTHISSLFPNINYNSAYSAFRFGRQRGRVVSASDSKSGGPGFESRSGHLLDLCSVVPSSNSRPRL